MKTHIGTFLSIGSPAVTELAAECGFDWVLIDLEHGCESEAALPNQLRALRGSNTLAIVRVSAPHADLIGRVLDWGAHGIMVPHVNTVEEARHCVDTAYYPPRGHRGVSRTVRTYGYGMRLPEGEMPKPIILAQIETASAVDQAGEIAAVEGIDALFIGPADLSFDLKAQKAARSYDECVDVIVKAARDHGKGCGILVRHADDKEKLKALGFTWIAMDSDLSLVREGFKKNLAAARAW
ncbi:HpcH/HpaI aldolase family protein [Prosthecobacter vanneervenii]|uniref:2-dehydro-3-deoxyglucarate aldolase/4-hydroxy-2-oxoheptanedioate aldolase n=1 Tax=Prosthecobacter vanneervenii TaxID=48466 RepID=A0A7W7YD71_9BACT|nr:aldolase/citrate lyase family protein [Prosthecobacter vanneervenii]MBB5034004.1 2-dehydro-3-deoxyglucarate aldolase/4-hydroxy-2-oxoheptanedioate aldolase [Prosthecobacter vanneervenii]